METIIRVAALYAFVILSLRLLGKREFGQLSPAELVTLLLIPEIASQALVRDDFSLTYAVIGLSTLFLLVSLTSLVSHRFKRAETLLEGSPTVLVTQGEFVVANMNRERITPDEVYLEMRHSGLTELGEVRWAILETDGRISIVGQDPDGPRGDPEPGRAP